jgi:hypothetical protein
MREVKKRKPFSSYMDLMCDLIGKEPTCFGEVVHKKEWEDSIIEEYQYILKNDVWEMVPRPKDKDVVSSKWLYKIKHVVDGSIEKHKERFVARGFSQKEGTDYEEMFAPVSRHTSIRTIIALAANMKWKLHQMDVKTTFLLALDQFLRKHWSCLTTLGTLTCWLKMECLGKEKIVGYHLFCRPNKGFIRVLY